MSLTVDPLYICDVLRLGISLMHPAAVECIITTGWCKKTDYGLLLILKGATTFLVITSNAD